MDPYLGTPDFDQFADFSDGSLPYLLDFLGNAGVRARVNVSETQVETPLLTSAAGTVVTLLNWRKDPIDSLSVVVTTSHDVEAATAIETGSKLKFTSMKAADGNGFVIAFMMPLVHCDFVTLPVKRTATEIESKVALFDSSTSVAIKLDDAIESFASASRVMTAAKRVAQARNRDILLVGHNY